MKKTILLCAAIFALGAMTACKSGSANETAADSIIEIENIDTKRSKGGLEHDWQLLLLGEWKVVRLDRKIITSGKERNDTVVPNLIWRFDEDGYYYETAWHQDDTNTYQYGYTLRNDSIMLREDSEQQNPWLVIDTLSQERMVLTNVDPSEHDTIVTTLTLKRTPKPSPMKQLLSGKINLYNANGKKDGLWLYEESDRMISEVHYCNGIECGELKVYIKGKLNCHFTGIEKTDTVIGLNRFEYRAHYKEYTDDGTTINKEGDGYYTGYEGFIHDGFLGIGDWRVYDTLDNTYKTVTLTEPAFDESIRIK